MRGYEHTLIQTMTVMTDDSFLNLRGKEVLVNIYYNIYNTNLNRSPIFSITVICHLSSLNRQKRPTLPAYRRKVIHDGRKLRIRGHDVTVR